MDTLFAVLTWTSASVALPLLIWWLYDLLHPFFRRRGRLSSTPNQPPIVAFNAAEEDVVHLDLRRPMPDYLQAPNRDIGPPGDERPDIWVPPHRVVRRPLSSPSPGSHMAIYDNYSSQHVRPPISGEELAGDCGEASTGVSQHNTDTTWQQILSPGPSSSRGRSEIHPRRRKGARQIEHISFKVDTASEVLHRTREITSNETVLIHHQPRNTAGSSDLSFEMPQVSGIQSKEETDQSGCGPPRSELTDVEEDGLKLPKFGTAEKGSLRSSGSSGSSKEKGGDNSPERDSPEKVERNSSEKSSPGKSSTSLRNKSAIKAAHQALKDDNLSSPVLSVGSERKAEKNSKESPETSQYNVSSSDFPGVHHLPRASISKFDEPDTPGEPEDYDKSEK